jgi:hypothetical protein
VKKPARVVATDNELILFVKTKNGKQNTYIKLDRLMPAFALMGADQRLEALRNEAMVEFVQWLKENDW